MSRNLRLNCCIPAVNTHIFVHICTYLVNPNHPYHLEGSEFGAFGQDRVTLIEDAVMQEIGKDSLINTETCKVKKNESHEKTLVIRKCLMASSFDGYRFMNPFSKS